MYNRSTVSITDEHLGLRHDSRCNRVLSGCPQAGCRSVVPFYIHFLIFSQLSIRFRFPFWCKGFPDSYSNHLANLIHTYTMARTITLQTPRTEILSSLQKHDESFTTLLSLIPAQYYIQPTQEEVSQAQNIVSQASRD
jgi:hypothetical protein